MGFLTNDTKEKLPTSALNSDTHDVPNEPIVSASSYISLALVF